ncbi:MAG: 23S rRNA (uracil(1939)-C(5))-methyltransferase RlmD [Nitrospirae bacterium]|nr:23S rRNA (uracil(1939)-C(5))-methyltransferase RlmD [Candidatus Manganitrophaceae bacterium]
MPDQILPLQIEKLVHGGDGLARPEGRVVFVPFTIPGETIEARIVRQKKEYAEAEIVTILTPSPERREAPCPVFTVCGGCQLQQLPEEAQLRYKVEAMQEVLARIGKITSVNLLSAIPSPFPFHYRTRTQLKVARGEIGYYRQKSHEIVSIERCPLLIAPLNAALEAMLRSLQRDRLEEIELQAVPAGDFLVVLRGDQFPHDRGEQFYESARQALPLKGVVVGNRRGWHIFGENFLIDTLQEKRFRISERAFSQVNPAVNRLLVERVLKWSAPTASDRILELYSGIGNFTLFLAERAGAVTAVEGNRAAIEDARWNLQSAGLENVTLQTASAQEGMRRAIKEEAGFSQIFLDPPREGAGKPVMEGIATLAPEKVIYLSCDPATFARDARVLLDRGYEITRLQPFDMFPQTGHLELLAEMRRKR